MMLRTFLLLSLSSSLYGQSQSVDALVVAEVPNFVAIDSLKITSWSSRLKHSVDSTFAASSRRAYANMDSVRRLGLPTHFYSRQADSLVQKRNELNREISEKELEMQSKIRKHYDSWNQQSRNVLRSDSSGISPPGLPTVQAVNVPATQLPGAQVPGVPGLPAMPGLSSTDFEALNLSPDLRKVGGRLSIPQTADLNKWEANLPDWAKSVEAFKAHQAELQSLSKEAAEAAETKVMEMSGAEGVQAQISQADQLMKQNEALKAAQKLKDPESVKQNVKHEAINHFNEKESTLKDAMALMTKYKQKYPTLGSISEIKPNDWLPHNGLKGIPFNKRFRIGFHMGYQPRKDTAVLDLFPSASYRFTGRIEAGAGFSYRLRMNTNSSTLDQQHPVWGTSVFTVVKTFRAVYVRLEVDGTSHHKLSQEGEPYRDWRWHFLSGIQTNFNISNRWIGNFQMLYAFDKSLKDAFPEALTARAGVQYKLK